MKRITAADLQPMLTTELDLGICCHRLGRHYCTPMNSLGQCSSACQNCQVHLSKIFDKVQLRQNNEHIRDPYGLLVWAIREEVAEIEEQGELSASPLTDRIGQRVDQNIFQMYLEQL
jgi:hypothetical protein